MAKTFKEMNADFKRDWQANINQTKAKSKKINAETSDKRAEIKTEFKQGVKESKAGMKKNSANKNMMLIWGIILLIPLALFGLVLFVMFVLLMWDIFFGL